VASAATVHAELLIGGTKVGTEEAIPVVNPADTRDVVGTIPRASREQVARATAAAADAFPTWSRVPMRERAQVLRAAAEALTPAVGARAELLVRESCALIGESRSGTARLGQMLEWYAGVGEAFEEVTELPSPNGVVQVAREPMGVAVLIVPWNSPTTLGFLGLAPILLAGNTVVVKPPTQAPLALMDAIDAMAPLFPPGTINVVTGNANEIGPPLITDPRVRKINFTGSTETGKAIMREAASTVKRVSLELGGNDPAVVLADADLETAVPGLVSGTFALTGQICYDVKRIYVHRSLCADFVAAFEAETSRFVVGNGMDERSTMGPLISDVQRQKVQALVADAEQRGATVRTLGRPLDEATWELGHFMLPTVVSGAPQSCGLVQAEQFGPAIPIVPFETEDEAIALANDSIYGLSSSIWSLDEERAFALARRIEAGTTFINVHRRGASGVDMPFGGFKESGIGRSHGVVALEEQLELHTISSRQPGGRRQGQP
jgi:aldehyde dehydrogenase